MDDATAIAEKIGVGTLTATQAAAEAIERVERLNPLINAVVTPLFDSAMERAGRLDEQQQQGASLGMLHGVPVLVKDLFDPLAGVRNTMGCRALRDNVASATAIHLQRLIDAGAVIIGKTNTPEFGHKGLTDNRLFGPTSCPFDVSRNAGGSSGGSAAAVAAGMVPIAQGSDAGGSVRIPAAWCGVVGYKPSYGVIANGGGWNVFASHTPMVHVGPLSTTVRDAALVARAMAGPSGDDPFSLPRGAVSLAPAAEPRLREIRVRYSADFGGFAVAPAVRKLVDSAVEAVRSAGIFVEDSTMKWTCTPEEITRLWRRQVGLAYADMFRSMSSETDWLLTHGDEIPDEIHEMVAMARAQSALDLRSDETLRTTIYRDLQQEFETCDLLITPTVGEVPVANSDNGCTLGPSEIGGQPTEPTIGWCLTHPVNETGHPAISLPAGVTSEGLPAGLQIIGRRYADDHVLALAEAFEQIRPWLPALLDMRNRLAEN